MKRIITLLSALAAALLLAVSAFAATLPGTAKCTITPSDTRVSGNTATVTYTITVTPPQGQQLGVFSVQLQPSQGLTLATSWEDANGNPLIDYVDDLIYNDSTRQGIFATYGYTAKTGYFAAVGTTPDRRMSDEATILTIQATMPADKAGTYTLNAEFIAALDGSGDVYTAQVITTPVTISAPGQTPTVDKTPVITETTADTPASPTTVTVRGSVKSYNPSNQVTIRLLQGAGDEKYKTTIAASTGSGQVPQDFSIANVAPGIYDLEVTKAAHLKYTIKNVVVPSSDLDLTTLTGKPYQTITLLCGDVNRDGSITESDVSVIRLSSNINKQITAAGVNPLADVNGDGSVTESDVSIVRLAVHINKSAVNNCTYKF